jgi:hypothetical protein
VGKRDELGLVFELDSGYDYLSQRIQQNSVNLLSADPMIAYLKLKYYLFIVFLTDIPDINYTNLKLVNKPTVILRLKFN